MRGLIAGGGHGVRLRPITYTRNKHLIKIANKPLIFYAIENLVNVGIRKIAMVIREDDYFIREVIGDGKKWSCSIKYIPQKRPAGLAHVVKIAQPFLGKRKFVFYLGDNMLRGGIAKYLEEFKKLKSNCHLLLAPVKHPERFGIPTFDKKNPKIIVKITEKPKRPKNNLAVSGIYFFDSNIFKAVNAIKPSWRHELEISDAITYLIKHGYGVTYSKIKGWWKDTGKPEDMLEANSLVLKEISYKNEGSIDKDSVIIGDVVIEKGAKIIASKINGPVVIGGGTKIKGSYIGPFTAISDNCIVENSEIEMSIIDSNSKIRNLKRRMQESLIGESVNIISNHLKPQSDRFIVGDQSTITVC